MSAIDVIDRALRAKVIREGLTYVPKLGATDAELAALSETLQRPLSRAHASILTRWNGLNLNILRIYGASPTPRELRGLQETQSSALGRIPGVIVFGDDSAGFMYGEAENGEVLQYDTKSDRVKTVASSLDDFFDRLVFGKDAAQFAGEKWQNDLRKVGLG